MTRMVLKWPFADGIDLVVPWSARDVVVHFGVDPATRDWCLWAEQAIRPSTEGRAVPVADYGPRPFTLVATGEKVPATWIAFGSAVRGATVAHLYAAPIPPEALARTRQRPRA